MNNKKLSKKILTLALCSMFAFSVVPAKAFADKAPAPAAATAIESEVNMPENEKKTFNFKKNGDEIKLKCKSPYTENGYVTFDISEKAVIRSESGIKPVVVQLLHGNTVYSEVEIVENRGSYRPDNYSDNDMYRFILPGGDLSEYTLKIIKPTFTSKDLKKEVNKDFRKDLNKDFDVRIKADYNKKSIKKAEELSDINNNKIASFVSPQEKTYRGFLFGNQEGKLITNFVMQPDAPNGDIMLRLKAIGGDNFSYSNDGKNNEYTIRYYINEDKYKEIKKSSKDDEELEDKNGSSYIVYKKDISEDTSVVIPWISTGIIEISMDKPNNFLTELSVEKLSDGSGAVGTVRPTIGTNPTIKDDGSDITANKPVEKLDASAVRFSGKDRYNTSIELSKKAFSKSDVAVLASGENFADALSGGGLAAINKAPLLLVNNNSVDSVKAELARLDVKKVYVLGGLNSISENIVNKISVDGREVVRLSGADRYETSMKVYNEFVNTNGAKKEPILVNGTVFADALSAGPLSADTKRAIVLTNGKDVLAGINKEDSNNIVIGGYNSMDSSFKGERFNGSDRYDTSVKIANHFASRDNAILASGENYPDGLSAITLSNKYNGPMLLTKKNSLPDTVKNSIKDSKTKNVYIVGGTNSISNSIQNLFK